MILFKDQSVAQATEGVPGDTYNITTNTLFIDSESLHGKLHSVETGRFPDEIGSEALRDVVWDALGPSQLETNLIRNICGESARRKT